MSKKLLAECIGTFWLVFAGCGSAVLASKFLDSQNQNVNYGIGLVGVALAFGLTVLTMAYAIGHISGCHLNPAVSIGLVIGGRFKAAELIPYVVAQVVGGLVGAAVLFAIASGKESFSLSNGFAANGYGEHSPDGYSLLACLVAEVVLTFMFLMIILGATDPRAPQGFAPACHRPWADADSPGGHPGDEFVGEPGAQHGAGGVRRGLALAQLWLFWIAPIMGAALAGVMYRVMAGTPQPAKPGP